MSTFAVFGMTRDVAMAEAKKTTKTVRMMKDDRGDQRPVILTPTEWQAAVEKRADEIMAGTKTKQLSVLFDAPSYADDFIALARRTLKCRDMHIKARVTLTDEKGYPLIDKKTKAPKIGWQPYGAHPNRSAA
ncbi:hypothetical protein [Pseudomonas citronellolis]|uniref:hypothetical protein n=1 Tax=Pseudomonas citronellolis TaxID=53408 RepID=UPI0023E3F6BF|nr:hypothetical protein [Pseudomonas citronellolis]MDF3932113.1 hypothetical protein [Pseudomonas citronellolis]